MEDIDLPPTLDEVKKAIKQTIISETSGIDGLPVEIFRVARYPYLSLSVAPDQTTVLLTWSSH